VSGSPLVSVLLPVHNGERYLRESVGSILSQTWHDFELVVINDGSNDGTASILESYNDPRMFVVENRKNLGLVKSLNLGLKRARGEYVARQDADDVSSPHRFGAQVEFLQSHSDVAIVGSDYIEMDQGRRTRVRMPQNVLTLRWHALFQNPFAHSTVMFRRAIVTELGGYADRAEALHVEDYELWLRLMWSGRRMANLTEPLVHWRANPDGISKTWASEQTENFLALVRTNLRRLAPWLLGDDRLVALVWRLQVCGGFNEPLAQVDKALRILEELVNNFCDYFGLDSGQKQLVRQMSRRRAARTMLHNAKQCSYTERLPEAREFAALALSLDKRLALSSSYRKLRVKSLLGQGPTARWRNTQKRIKRAVHLS
jgi:glycosyltransferase involved in cell wall biosynthesis